MINKLSRFVPNLLHDLFCLQCFHFVIFFYVSYPFLRFFIFLSLFQIFFMICLFGLFHGLILLPVVLAILGPVEAEDKKVSISIFISIWIDIFITFGLYLVCICIREVILRSGWPIFNETRIMSIKYIGCPIVLIMSVFLFVGSQKTVRKN